MYMLVCIHMHSSARAGPRLTSRIFLDNSLSYILKQGLSFDSKNTILHRLFCTAYFDILFRCCPVSALYVLGWQVGCQTWQTFTKVLGIQGLKNVTLLYQQRAICQYVSA